MEDVDSLHITGWPVTKAPSKKSQDELALRLATLEREVARLQSQMAMLMDLERLRDGILAQGGEVVDSPLSPVALLQASEFIEAGSGFHFLEYGEDGTPYRWTGPDPEARLVFWVDRSRLLRLQVRVRSFGAGGPERPVVVTIDGQPYPARLVPQASALVAGPLPVLNAIRPTEVVLRSPVMFSPAQDGGSDERLLGMAISHIELVPA
ncbi:hypothetical protein SAMN02927895_05587 [Belnapia rosea]|nr:hypothetical protein SAMN02927895_05587 [Belnapia rosea]